MNFTALWCVWSVCGVCVECVLSVCGVCVLRDWRHWFLQSLIWFFCSVETVSELSSCHCSTPTTVSWRTRLSSTSASLRWRGDTMDFNVFGPKPHFSFCFVFFFFFVFWLCVRRRTEKWWWKVSWISAGGWGDQSGWRYRTTSRCPAVQSVQWGIRGEEVLQSILKYFKVVQIFTLSNT